MAFRDPKLYIAHALKDAGQGSVTVSSEATGFEKHRLLDDRKNQLFRFGATTADQYIQVDRGASPSPSSLDAMIIPSGHNLGGACNLRLDVSATGVFGGEETTIVASFQPADSAVIRKTFTADSSRYWRLIFETAGTAWEIGELVLTEERTFGSIGIRPRYRDAPEPNFAETRLPSGERFADVLGPQQRVIEVGWVGVSGSGITTFDDLVSTTSGGAPVPWWFLPPDDALEVLQVVLEEAIQRQQDSPDPVATGLRYTIDLQLVEAVG